MNVVKFVGYDSCSENKEKWAEFEKVLHQYNQVGRKAVHEYFEQNGVPPLPLLTRTNGLVESPFLNIYQYPQELDYDDVRPLPSNWVRVDTFGMGRYEHADEWPLLTQAFLNQPGKLIYFSLGTIGCCDVELVERLARILAKLPHKIIVSKGHLGDQIDLSDCSNVLGANFVPQLSILPWADLVITHGGNNTFTEAFALGKPMIVMPLFGDQFDNAQRVHETGWGLRMNPYCLTQDELILGVNRLLSDAKLKHRLQMAAQRVRDEHNLDKACDALERLPVDVNNNLARQ